MVTGRRCVWWLEGDGGGCIAGGVAVEVVGGTWWVYCWWCCCGSGVGNVTDAIMFCRRFVCYYLTKILDFLQVLIFVQRSDFYNIE